MLDVPWAPFDVYPAAMTLMDVALAPAGRNNFFRGKSDLRWLEAARARYPARRRPGRLSRDRARRHRLPRVDARTRCASSCSSSSPTATSRERVGAAAKAHVVRVTATRASPPQQWVEVLPDRRAPVAA